MKVEPVLLALLRILDRREHKERMLSRDYAAILQSQGLVEIMSDINTPGLSHYVKLTRRGEEFLRELPDD